MANPQKEDGYVAFANNLWDAICRIRIPGEARQCFDFIARKTYGWNQTKDKISLSQFVNNTGIRRPHVCRSLKILKQMNMIIITNNGTSTISEYAIQKDFDKWKPLPKKGVPKTGVPKTVIGITKNGTGKKISKNLQDDYQRSGLKEKNENTGSPKKGTHKTKSRPTITKDIIPESENEKKAVQKKEWPPRIKFLVNEYFKTLNERQQKRFEKMREKFHNCCNKLMRTDGFNEEEIRKAIRFARYDTFWSQNFLSFLKLRQKDKTGTMYIELFLNKANKQRSRQTEIIDLYDDTPSSDNRRANWLKMIDEHIRDNWKLSIFKETDLSKIQKITDAPTYERIISILKEKEEK